MSKYHAVKTTIDGITFDSKIEAHRYQDLVILQKAGLIKDLKVHPKFVLLEPFEYRGQKIGAITYTADFQYVATNLFNHYSFSEVVVEDVKGVRTAVFNVKWKLAKFKYPSITWRLNNGKEVYE